MRPASLLLRATIAVLACFTPAFAQFQPGIAPPPPGDVAAAAPVPGSLPRSRRENPAVSIQDLVKIAGQNASPIRGMGIVTGLPKTGDSGAELALARPLMQIYANNGMPLGEIRELSKAKGTSAIVSIWAEIPESGGRAGDRMGEAVAFHHEELPAGQVHPHLARRPLGVIAHVQVAGPAPGRHFPAVRTGVAGLAAIVELAFVARAAEGTGKELHGKVLWSLIAARPGGRMSATYFLSSGIGFSENRIPLFGPMP